MMSISSYNASTPISEGVQCVLCQKGSFSWLTLLMHTQRHCQHKVPVEQLKDTFLFSQARLVRTAKQEYRSTLPKMKGCRSKAVLEAKKEAVEQEPSSCSNIPVAMQTQASSRGTVTETTAADGSTWKMMLCWVRCDPDGKVSEPFQCGGLVSRALQAPVSKTTCLWTDSTWSLSIQKRSWNHLRALRTLQLCPSSLRSAVHRCVLRNQGRLLNLCLQQCGTMSKMPSKHTVDFARLLHESRSAKSGLCGSRQPQMIAQKLIARSVLCKHAKSRDWNYSSNGCRQT